MRRSKRRVGLKLDAVSSRGLCSVRMLEFLLESNGLSLEQAELDPVRDWLFIKELILGDLVPLPPSYPAFHDDQACQSNLRLDTSSSAQHGLLVFAIDAKGPSSLVHVFLMSPPQHQPPLCKQ